MKSRVRGLTFRPDGRAVIQWEDGSFRQRQETIPAVGKDGRPLSQKGMEAEAQRRLHEYRERARRERQGLDPLTTEAMRMPLADLLDWWWEHRGKNLKTVAIPHLLSGHVRPDLGAVALRELTTARLRRWLADKEAAGVGGVYRNHLRALLHNVFSVASTPGGPWAGRPNPVQLVPRARVHPKPKKILEPHEWERVLEEVPERWRGAVALALYAGLREGEVFGMLKEDVDLAAERLMVGRSWDEQRPKGGKTLPVPIASRLLPYLVEALKSPGLLLFPQEDGSMQPRNLRLVRMLQAAVARAGVLDGYEHRCRAWRCGWREKRPSADVPDACPRCGRKTTYAIPIARKVNFHGLRHSFGTAVVRSSGLALGQRLLRHSDPRLTANVYAHLDDRDSIAALAAVQAEVEAGRRPASFKMNTAPALRSSSRGNKKAPEPRYSLATPGPYVVGATGFEPATTCTPSKCATRLRYAPETRGEHT